MQCKKIELKYKAMSLTFREKNALAKELANDSFIEKDKELLKKHFPQDKLLHRSVSPSRPDLSFDIIFALLEFESADAIRANRNEKNVVQKEVIEISPVKDRSEKNAAVKKKSQKKRSTQK